MADLEELAARVEGLTGPDREVDARIWCALHSVAFRGDDGDVTDVGFTYYDPRWKGPCWQQGMWYTASLDAAMTLVPEEAFWRLGHDGDGADPSEFRAQLIVPMLGGKDPRGVSIAGSPALALTAAALRARARTQGNQNG